MARKQWKLGADSGCIQLRESNERYGKKSTMIRNQLPIEHWHKWIGEASLGDAITDRLIHNAYTMTLKGDSMRKRLAVTLNLK